MITKGDDYPLHQTPDPIAYTGANRNFYDRYFFNGYDRSGEVFFAAAMGIYPYVNVLDGAFSIIVDGVQHNAYGSRVMHMERLDTSVGPVAVEVVQPLKVLRVVCDDEEQRIRADVTFTARTLPHEEPRFLRRSGSQVMMDVTRMTQFGNWSGWIEVKGRRIEVSPDNFRGTRDRSWGIRGVGQADPQPNPEAGRPQFYWLWAPLNFEEFAAHYFVNDDAEGESWNSNGIILPVSDFDAPPMRSWRSHMEFKTGTRHAKSATIDFTDKSGGDWHFELTPKWHFYMRGIGYTHPHWRHGSYHGELETGYDEFSVEGVDPTDVHIQAMCDVRLTHGDKRYEGQGVLEQLIIGPHAPSGFTDMMDMAK
ncbi:MAG: hypothetical protein KDI19_06465 [Pseudomonadales bacterium]|nr:hypothetical protein [Pseudomonadales bacterium]